jgi:hypothetical protein
MAQNSIPAGAADPGISRADRGLYVLFTVTAALVAAGAAHISLTLAVAPWAMFMGWVAYFTRKPSAAEGLRSFVCVVIGLCFGAAATFTASALTPTLESLALPVTVFGTALAVIAARGLPVLNNLLGYFIGLITYFAAHPEPGFLAIAELAGAVGLGSLAGWLAHSVESQVRQIGGQVAH